MGPKSRMFSFFILVPLSLSHTTSCGVKDVTGILTGQGYLASSKSLRSGALERERDRKNIQKPQGCGAT